MLALSARCVALSAVFLSAGAAGAEGAEGAEGVEGVEGVAMTVIYLSESAERLHGSGGVG